jgi:hypothetical protein
VKVVLENDALIRTVDFSKRPDTNYFHRIDARRLDISTTETELDLVGSSISITFSRERERMVRNRNAHQNEGGIGRWARKGGDFSDEGYRTRCGDEPDPPI